MAGNVNLRNRANDRDRPRDSHELRQVYLVDRPQANRCSKETGGHNHVFQRGDRYGCCTRCGDEVLT